MSSVISSLDAGAVALEHFAIPPELTETDGASTGGSRLPPFDGIEVGVWEHSTGISIDTEASEVFVVISGRGLTQPEWAHLDEEIAHRPFRHLADELAHEGEPATCDDGALLRLDVACNHPHQGGLACSIRAHKRCRRALRDPECHIVEKHPAVRQRVGDALYINMTHCAVSWLRVIHTFRRVSLMSQRVRAPS